MAGRFQLVCIDYLYHFGSLSFLYTAERGSQFEHDVVPIGYIFCIVS